MSRITGHVRVEERRDGRVWVAKYMRASGARTRKVLGPAWVRDSGRRTERGAVVWLAASGRAPEGHLTPKQAGDRLLEILTVERARPRRAAARVTGRSFGQACDAFLEYAEFDRGIAPTTLQRYEGIVRVHLKPAFGAGTPLGRLAAGRIEEYRGAMLAGGALSRSAMRQHLMVLGGVLKLAQRRGWIAHNVMADVEGIRMAKSSGDFNVLEPAQVERTARAAGERWERVEPGGRDRTRITEARAAALNEQRGVEAAVYAELIRFAAFTGRRIGELRALRWRDINVHDAIVHVRENFPTSAPAGSVTKAPKSELVRSVPLSAPAEQAVERLKDVSRFTAIGDVVFPSPTGVMVDGGDVRDAFYAALRNAGLGHLREKARPMTFHDLRHTFGTLAVRVFPLTDVQAYMGHADITTTMRYVHHVPRHDAAQRLSEAFAIEEDAAA